MEIHNIEKPLSLTIGSCTCCITKKYFVTAKIEEKNKFHRDKCIYKGHVPQKSKKKNDSV